MTSKQTWLLSGILFIGFTALQWFYFPTSYVADTELSKILLMLVDFFAGLFTVALFAVIGSCVVALIPFKGRPYKSKFMGLLPILFVVVLLVQIISMSFIAYEARRNGPHILQEK